MVLIKSDFHATVFFYSITGREVGAQQFWEKYSNIDTEDITVQTKAITTQGAMERPVLTNYDDRYVIMTSGYTAGAMSYVQDSKSEGVQLYDIKRDVWSACPKRKHDTIDHEGVCVGGKLFLFFAKYVVGKRSRHNVSIIEKFDIQSHIEGKSVQWEDT